MGLEIPSDGGDVDIGQLSQCVFVDLMVHFLLHKGEDIPQPIRGHIGEEFGFAPFAASKTRHNGFMPICEENDILDQGKFGSA